jgi:hypothetical protein
MGADRSDRGLYVGRALLVSVGLAARWRRTRSPTGPVNRATPRAGRRTCTSTSNPVAFTIAANVDNAG